MRCMVECTPNKGLVHVTAFVGPWPPLIIGLYPMISHTPMVAGNLPINCHLTAKLFGIATFPCIPHIHTCIHTCMCMYSVNCYYITEHTRWYTHTHRVAGECLLLVSEGSKRVSVDIRLSRHFQLPHTRTCTCTCTQCTCTTLSYHTSGYVYVHVLQLTCTCTCVQYKLCI